MHFCVCLIEFRQSHQRERLPFFLSKSSNTTPPLTFERVGFVEEASSPLFTFKATNTFTDTFSLHLCIQEGPLYFIFRGSICPGCTPRCRTWLWWHYRKAICLGGGKTLVSLFAQNNGSIRLQEKIGDHQQHDSITGAEFKLHHSACFLPRSLLLTRSEILCSQSVHPLMAV